MAEDDNTTSNTKESTTSESTATTSTTTDDASTTNGNNGSSDEIVEEDILYLLLDCRLPTFVFNPVKEIEVCAALQLEHGDDHHTAVQTFRGRNLGTFSIESTDMKRYVGTHLVIRGKEIPLTPIRKRKPNQPQQQHRNFSDRRRFHDPDGLKIRIFDAWKIHHRQIPHNAFNEYFEQIGVEIIKPTQPERCREYREVFNTNRFIVVRKIKDDGTVVDFGERISVAGVSFKLSYFGIQRYCGLCDTAHGWECPIQIHNDFLRALRKGKTNKAKLYSDSTLRHVNQLALTTDTACMTGGGIAQLCNAIPFDKPHEEVIIKAGTNELNEENLNQFVYTIEKTKEKLAKMAEEVKVTVVLPSVPTSTPEQTVKGQFMTESFESISSIQVIKLEEVDMADFRHPSRKGTTSIINQIHAKIPIILTDCEEDDTTYPSKYRGVQTLFKVGCRGCDSPEFTRSLCTTCIANANKQDTTEIIQRIQNLHEQMYPPVQTDVDMKDANKKRVLDDDDNDNVGDPNAKVVRPNSH